MDFSSINLDTCCKLFASFPSSWVIYNEDSLLMICWCIPWWDALCRVENFKSLQIFIKMQGPRGGGQ